MEMSAKQSSYILTFLISTLLIQQFIVVHSAGGNHGKGGVKRTGKLAGQKWCIPKSEVSDPKLKANRDHACEQVDCKPIQPGGPCFVPNNAWSHAAYAMNAFYQIKGRNHFNCDFAGTAVLTNVDPSYGACKYPS